MKKPKNALSFVEARHLMPGLAAGMAGAVFTLLAPGRLEALSDLLLQGMPGGSGFSYAAIQQKAMELLALYGGALLLGVAEGILLSGGTQRLAKSVRTTLFRKWNRLPLRFFQRFSRGDLLSRMTVDAEQVGASFGESAGALIRGGTMLLGALFLMFFSNWQLALAAVGSTVLGWALLLLILGKTQRFFDRQQQAIGCLNGLIEELYAGQTTVLAHCAEREMLSRFDMVNRTLTGASRNAQLFSGWMLPLMTLVGNLGYAVVCTAGGLLAVSGRISFGMVVAFLFYVSLFSEPLSELADALSGLQNAAAAQKRVNEVLREPEHASALLKTVQKPAEGAVDFQKVTFGYQEQQPVIRQFSALILPGWKVAVVGPTGAGKTTLMALLLGFFSPDQGTILIDGVPLKELPEVALRQQFCYVPQQPWLFAGTLRENICFNTPEIGDQQLKELCIQAELMPLIETLPDGLNTVLTEQSALSAGQKQLIALARAMARNAPIVVLDEATASVDTLTEQRLQRAMDQLMRGRTAFLIAHRLNTVKNVDRILVLKDGRLAESGTHTALLKKHGIYAALYHDSNMNANDRNR